MTSYDRTARPLSASDKATPEPVGGCPCLYVEPCFPSCTCATPVLSGGCDRCCRYGSLEQRKAAAKRLANALKLVR